MRRMLKYTGLACVTIFGLIFVALVVIISAGPDTAVYTGRQIPKKYMKTIRSLELLEEDEQIRYFYSDALFDIKTGLYFVTNKNLIVYSSSWEEPETIIPFDQIVSLVVQYDDSFWEDSYVMVTTSSEVEISFPVSSEKALDKKFVEAIQEKMNVRQEISTDAEKPDR